MQPILSIQRNTNPLIISSPFTRILYKIDIHPKYEFSCKNCNLKTGYSSTGFWCDREPSPCRIPVASPLLQPIHSQHLHFSAIQSRAACSGSAPSAIADYRKQAGNLPGNSSLRSLLHRERPHRDLTRDMYILSTA